MADSNSDANECFKRGSVSTKTLSESTTTKLKPDRLVLAWLRGSFKTLSRLFNAPKSFADERPIASYGIYLSLFTGIIFCSLVGLMFSAITITVLQMLADNSLIGLVSMFVQAETLINLMGGG